MKLALILLLSTLNGIYLQTIAVGIDSFTSGQQATLEAIACQYPLEGGDAVYSARVMLGVGFGCFNNNRTAPWPEENNEAEIPEETGFFARIYPNPNDGWMTLEYELKDEGEFRLYDVSGKLIQTISLPQGYHSVGIKAGLGQGVYYHQIVSENKVFATGKVVVIK